MDSYLSVDRLRPGLRDAIVGLSWYVEHLTKQADRFLQWPWTQKDRQAAVNQFASLLGELRGYLESLDGDCLQDLGNRTGVGVDDLVQLRNHLDAPDRSADLVSKFAEDRIRNRDKSTMFRHTEEIRNCIERLRSAFF